MGKTSLKTFVCSFVLSLFTILTVNKEFFSVSKPSDAEIKIPNKNISLFFKSMPSHTMANKTIPIKKIALTVPLASAEDISVSLPQDDLIPLTFANKDIEFNLSAKPETGAFPPPPPANAEVIINSPQDVSVEEAEKTANIELPELPADTIDDQELLSPFSSKIVQAHVQIIRPNEQKIAQRLKKTAADTAEVLAQTDIPLESTATKPQAEETSTPEPLATTTPDEEPRLLAAVPDDEITPEDDTSDEEDVVLPPTFKIAKAAQNPDTLPPTSVAKEQNNLSGEPENLLIPLQKDDFAPVQTAEAKVAHSPDDNKLAMLTGKASIRSMEEGANPPKADKEKPAGWQTMAQKNNEDSTWIAAKGTGHQRNRQTAKKKYYQNADNQKIKKALETEKQANDNQDVKLAAQVVKNLLIPIPEEILNDPNLTPQLVASEQDKEIEQQLIEQENLLADKPSFQPQQTTLPSDKTDGKGLLKSITSIFSKDDNAKQADNNDNEGTLPSFINKFTGKKRTKPATGKILPTEIRLAFQPNRAEISGVTLKWLQAFANKTIEDNNAGLDIRIDGASSYQLQQKRLNLLHNILTNNGVDYRKIKTVFTTREPNSFIIRTVRLNNDTNGGIKENNEWQDYYKAW